VIGTLTDDVTVQSLWVWRVFLTHIVCWSICFAAFY